jgi:hypothetical protein
LANLRDLAIKPGLVAQEPIIFYEFDELQR